MAVTYLGGGSVGTFMPTTLAALAGAEAAIGLPVADLQAQVGGAIAASASIAIQPPSIDLAAALSAAVQLPGVAIDVSVMGTLVLELQAEISALQLALNAVLGIVAQLGHAGVYAWELQGPVGNMAAELGSQLNGGLPGLQPTDQGAAIVLVGSVDSGSAAILRALFSA